MSERKFESSLQKEIERLEGMVVELKVREEVLQKEVGAGWWLS